MSRVKGFVRDRFRRAARKILDEDSDFGPAWAEDYTLNRIYVPLVEKEGCAHAYTWGVLQAVRLAQELGLERISVIEFGVAGGNSLLALERIAGKVEEHYRTRIDMFGFDTGRGLPKPVDVRDMPNLWQEGAFAMDVNALRSRLARAQLVLGLVEETVPRFIASAPAPVGFVAFDLDLYTSTSHALQLFVGDPGLLLPRVHCYFDDILAYTFGDHVGERLAISEFNHAQLRRKLSPIHGLQYYMPRRLGRDPAVAAWLAKYYMLHVFDHRLYREHDGLIEREHRSLMLRPDA